MRGRLLCVGHTVSCAKPTGRIEMLLAGPNLVCCGHSELCKTGWTDQDAACGADCCWLSEACIRRGCILAPLSEYDRSIRARQRCCHVSNYSDLFFTRVLAMALCPCLSVCLSQVGVLSKRMDGVIWFLTWRLLSTSPTLCFKEIQVSTTKIKALSSGTVF